MHDVGVAYTTYFSENKKINKDKRSSLLPGHPGFSNDSQQPAEPCRTGGGGGDGGVGGGPGGFIGGPDDAQSLLHASKHGNPEHLKNPKTDWLYWPLFLEGQHGSFQHAGTDG